MNHSDDLFKLVKSLSKNEKRYFHLFSGLQEGEKNYLDLFNAVDDQKEYDEKVFVKKFKEKSFTKNLAWRKHHLYDTILSALESYHTSQDTEVYSLIHRGEILLEKGLYKQALKVLAKAKAIAQKNETFTLLLEVLRWEEMVAIKLSDMPKQISIAKELDETHTIFSNAIEHKNILNAVYKLHNSTGFFRKKKDEQPIADILKSKAWSDDSQALSWKAKRYFYYSHFLYCFMKGDMQAGYVHCKKNAESFFNNPGHITYSPQVYINALNSLMYCCSSLNKHNEMINYIIQFKETKKYFSKNHQGSAILLSYHELDYYSITGKIQDGFLAAKKIEKELLENEYLLSSLEKTGLLINLGMMYFMNEKYRETIALLNRVMYEPVLDSRSDMDGMVRIFYLICHYERGASRQFMKSLVRSAYRRLAKRKGIHKFENIILEFIRKKLIRVKTEEQLTELFTQLRKQMLVLKKDPYESRPLEYFDLISWLTGKIEGKKFSEVVVARKE